MTGHDYVCTHMIVIWTVRMPIVSHANVRMRFVVHSNYHAIIQQLYGGKLHNYVRMEQ